MFNFHCFNYLCVCFSLSSTLFVDCVDLCALENIWAHIKACAAETRNMYFFGAGMQIVLSIKYECWKLKFIFLQVCILNYKVSFQTLMYIFRSVIVHINGVPCNETVICGHYIMFRCDWTYSSIRHLSVTHCNTSIVLCWHV